jgi:hypothetical protein
LIGIGLCSSPKVSMRIGGWNYGDTCRICQWMWHEKQILLPGGRYIHAAPSLLSL